MAASTRCVLICSDTLGSVLHFVVTRCCLAHVWDVKHVVYSLHVKMRFAIQYNMLFSHAASTAAST